MNEAKISLFVCDCAGSMNENINIDELIRLLSEKFDGLEIFRQSLLCSEDGQAHLRNALLEKKPQRVVVAACSPKQHELTFRKVMEQAGINPYMMQMVNLREQIAWVTGDKEAATQKAFRQLASAVKRVRLHKPLDSNSVECKKDFVVIGGGAAGIMAALTLAKKNRKVYLVEKKAWLGGKTTAFGEAFPNFECATCMLQPKLDDILHNGQVQVMTLSEVSNLKGFFGNFDIEITSRARCVDVDKCIGCGACYEACPVSVKNSFDGNLSRRKAIYTGFTGMLPNAPMIDSESCLRSRGEQCTKCQEACPFGAVNYGDKDKTMVVEAGAVVVATGAEIDAGLNPRQKVNGTSVLDAYQMERYLSPTGPTGGKPLKDGRPPKSIAFIMCSGSRDARYKEYCSGVCCGYAAKLAHLSAEKTPGVKIYRVFSERCFPGKTMQQLFNRTVRSVEDIRVPNTNDVTITADDASAKIDCGNGLVVEAELAVLVPPIVPGKDQKQLAQMLGISLDAHGFFESEHPIMTPVSSAFKGIYMAGTAAGPKSIAQSIAEAEAAAGCALGALVPGESMELERMTAHVDEDKCASCRSCVPLCPYQAISFDEEKRVARVNKVLCMGCGVCGTACPSGAIESQHFTDEEIFSEIEGALQ